jgi:signal transduction histidine kinase
VSLLSALTLLPLLAVTLAVGLTAARFGRKVAGPLWWLCVLQAGWVLGLILLQSGQVSWAERLLPCGMLLAGAFVQAADSLAGTRHRLLVGLTWAGSAAVALTGLLAPRLLYGPGARGPGPLFLPLAVASAVGTCAVGLALLQLARRAPTPRERRRRGALFLANTFGALGGGGAIGLHITVLAPVDVAAPFLLVSVLTAAYAVWSSEDLRGRDLLRRGFLEAGLTAGLSALALWGWYAVAPWLVPTGTPRTLAGLGIAFLCALPFEPLRQLLVERVLEATLPGPVGVRGLTSAIEREETRADQAERLAELGRVASAVAHEIRNPLGVILAEVKLLEREGASGEGVAAVRAQVQRASRFVDELLRYATPRPLEVSEVDVTAALATAAQEAARGMALPPGRIALPAGEGPVIEADGRALQDVVRNLISNALIATRDGEGVRVRVLLEEEPAHVRIQVEDDGPGVPPEVLDRLFQPFVTGRGRDARHPGTGLGLAISARLAARQGATLAHQRPASGGARFVARWPKRPPGLG